MIISLISSVLGMAGGLLPNIFKEIRESREHTREIARMDNQAELQLKLLAGQTDAKLAEIEGNVQLEEMRAFRAQMKSIYEQQAPIGIKWVDAWNAALRPFVITGTAILFFIVAGMFSFGAIMGQPHLADTANVIWASLVGDAIQAVWGYLFGYRSSAKVRGRIAAQR